jgi:hypothetical protein
MSEQPDESTTRFDVMLREATAFVCFPNTVATEEHKYIARIAAIFALQTLDLKTQQANAELAALREQVRIAMAALSNIKRRARSNADDCPRCGKVADLAVDALAAIGTEQGK